MLAEAAAAQKERTKRRQGLLLSLSYFCFLTERFCFCGRRIENAATAGSILRGRPGLRFSGFLTGGGAEPDLRSGRTLTS